MNFLISELFLGLSSLLGMFWLSFVKVKSSYLTDYLIKLIVPIFLVFIWLNINLYGINVEIYFSTMFLDEGRIFFKISIACIILCILISSLSYFLKLRVEVVEYSLLVVLSVLGTFLVVLSNDFFFFFLALELQNLGFYVLAALQRYESKSVEAGIKYYIMGSLSSSLILFGIVILYGFFGTLNFFELKILVSELNLLDNNFLLVYFALCFVFCGLAFKLGVAPFHW